MTDPRIVAKVEAALAMGGWPLDLPPDDRTPWFIDALAAQGLMVRDADWMSRVEDAEWRLAEAYRRDPVLIAAMCDEDLDRSGALLGRVRILAADEAARSLRGKEAGE